MYDKLYGSLECNDTIEPRYLHNSILSTHIKLHHIYNSYSSVMSEAKTQHWLLTWVIIQPNAIKPTLGWHQRASHGARLPHMRHASPHAGRCHHSAVLGKINIDKHTHARNVITQSLYMYTGSQIILWGTSFEVSHSPRPRTQEPRCGIPAHYSLYLDLWRPLRLYRGYLDAHYSGACNPPIYHYEFPQFVFSSPL